MRILIAGKRASLRNALKTFIQACPGLEIVAIASDKEELPELLAASAPDLLLLDEGLDDRILDAVVLPVKKYHPRIAIHILGQHSERKDAYLEAGVAAYLTKDDSPKSLLTAIEEVRLQRDHG